jgi:hypothetical protein
LGSAIRSLSGRTTEDQKEAQMAIFAVIVLGPACLFLLYVLVQFWREAMRLRSEAAKHRAAADRLLEVSARGSKAGFGRPDGANYYTTRPAEDSRGIVAFPSGVKHSAGRRTA